MPALPIRMDASKTEKEASEIKTVDVDVELVHGEGCLSLPANHSQTG
jgi:hypothetical protein